MATTVTYKGSTLTTVNNQTRTLLTSGKYMEDNLTLTDVSGGGGFSVAEVEITNNTEYEQHFEMVHISDYGEEEYSAMMSTAWVGSLDTLTFYIVLYNGIGDAFLVTDFPEDYVLTVTGDAEVSEFEPFVTITGNCTITIDEVV